MPNQDPPIETPFLDPVTGQIAEVWRIYLREVGATAGTLAPVTAPYWTSTSTPALVSERNLGLLASGYVKVLTTFGIAEPSTVGVIPSADVTGLVAALATLALIVPSSYTPTTFNVANLSASTPFACQYLRTLNFVTVTGRVDADPVTTATDTQLGISLPIASNFTAVQQCAGTAWAPTLTSEGAAILADITNDRAVMQWKAVDVTNAARYFSFSYQVL
jgi:hypothetical protein